MAAMANKLSLLLTLWLPLVLGSLTLRQAPESSIVYQKLHVDSLIVARYAVTTVTSVIQNTGSMAQQLNFQVQLPETAFISAFRMMVNETTYNGVAKEKDEAREEFDDRVSAGQNVGLVESRGTSLFQISINTAANSNATFTLSYEQLLIRRASRYSQVINLNPGQIVEDVQTTIRVIDNQDLAITEGSNFLIKETLSPQEVVYRYSPTVDEQNDDTFGLARDIEVKFDVNHPPDGPGLILVNNCYFTQFFSPSGLTQIPVDIVFVIDVSGSMSGTKIDQTRQALERIISELRAMDRFTMVTFSSEIKVWRSELLLANSNNKQIGTEFARSLIADGGTDFNGGLIQGINILLDNTLTTSIPLIVMLTDGEPTSGVTNQEEIRENARRLIHGTRISLNCLGFGFSLNFVLLQQLSLENNGIVRRIYEAEDAVEQLEGFFDEISSPILHTVQINYPENSFEEISNREFPILFKGSEIVVAGKFSAAICENPDFVVVTVTGMGTSGEISFTGQVDTGDSVGLEPSTERLTAYLTIQQLLDQRLVIEDDTLKVDIEERALALALKYNFVTELTSLIVVQEDGNGNFTQGEQQNNGLNELDGALIPARGGGGGTFNSCCGGGVGLSYTLAAMVIATLTATLFNYTN